MSTEVQEQKFPCPCCKGPTNEISPVRRACTGGCVWESSPSRGYPQDYISSLWWDQDGVPSTSQYSNNLARLRCPLHKEEQAPTTPTATPENLFSSNHPCPCCREATQPLTVTNVQIYHRRVCEDQCRWGGNQGTVTKIAVKYPLPGWSTTWWNENTPKKIPICTVHGPVCTSDQKAAPPPTTKPEALASIAICPRCLVPATETRYPGNEPICTNERCDGKGFPIWFLKAPTHPPLAEVAWLKAGVQHRMAERIRSIPAIAADPGIVRMQQDLRLTRLTISTATFQDKPSQHPACIHQQAGGIHECACRKARAPALAIHCDSE